MLTVREAIQRARENATEFYQDAEISDLQLEEVELDEAAGLWLITLGFNVPNANPMRGLGAAIAGERQYIRKYKIFNIDVYTGDLKSMKIREV